MVGEGRRARVVLGAATVRGQAEGVARPIGPPLPVMLRVEVLRECTRTTLPSRAAPRWFTQGIFISSLKSVYSPVAKNLHMRMIV